MAAQKKSLVVVLREAEACFFAVTETEAQLVQSVPTILVSKTLRTFSSRRRDLREVFLVIDDVPAYHSLLTEVPRTKEELAQVWDCAGPFAYRELRRENKYLYIGYSYTPALLQKYIALFKKTGVMCKGIIPADFLYQGGPLQLVHANHHLRIRLFDGQGGVYSSLLLSAATAAQDTARIGQYALREKIILPVALQTMTELYPPEILLQRFYELVQPSVVLYSQEKQQQTVRIRLTTLQKTLLVFVTLLALFVAGTFTWSAYRIAQVRRHIRQLKQQAAAVAPQAARLQELETKTAWLKQRGPSVSPELAQVLTVIRQSQGTLTEMSYVAERKLLSVVILDTADRRNDVIKACQQSKYFSAVNLIYIRPQGRFLEYKLILTVR